MPARRHTPQTDEYLSTVSFISSTGMRSMYEKGLAHPSLRVDHCYYKQ